jgi:hypothetical protein
VGAHCEEDVHGIVEAGYTQGEEGGALDVLAGLLEGGGRDGLGD